MCKKFWVLNPDVTLCLQGVLININVTYTFKMTHLFDEEQVFLKTHSLTIHHNTVTPHLFQPSPSFGRSQPLTGTGVPFSEQQDISMIQMKRMWKRLKYSPLLHTAVLRDLRPRNILAYRNNLLHAATLCANYFV